MKVVTHVYDVRKNLEKYIKKEFSDFEIVDKRNSLLMKLLSKILFFNKRFMSSYSFPELAFIALIPLIGLLAS
tara:strand:- start:106 stop:324 length:219 start_codon:yes stop_codon:yes gene_type:complete